MLQYFYFMFKIVISCLRMFGHVQHVQSTFGACSQRVNMLNMKNVFVIVFMFSHVQHVQCMCCASANQTVTILYTNVVQLVQCCNLLPIRTTCTTCTTANQNIVQKVLKRCTIHSKVFHHCLLIQFYIKIVQGLISRLYRLYRL